MKEDPASRWMPLLNRIADAADQISLLYFRRAGLSIREKEDKSPVSEADLAIEGMARKLASAHDRSLSVYGEEEGDPEPTSEIRLIIDPIDGTRNFIRGIPIFATLLAIEASGEIVAGLVSAPALRTRWSAARGKGAYRDRERMQVSARAELEKAHIFHGSLARQESPDPPLDLWDLLRAAERSRGFGDFYQHILVAEGAGEVAIEAGLKPWDIAALQVIIEEAGGRATSITGARSIYGGSLLATNGRLHEQVIRILNRIA